MSCDQEPFAYDNDVGLGEEFGRRPAEPNQYEQIQMASKATPTPLQENTPHPVSSITVTQPEENAQSTGSSVCHKTTCKRLIVGLCVAVFVVVIILTATFLSLNRNDGKQSDVNECESSPCRNGGNCTDDVGRYQCSCPTGYTGDNCNTDINECESNPCGNGGNCTDGDGWYQCSCIAGYTGDNCHTDFDECRSNPCRNGGNCSDDVGRYHCSCPTDYTGDNCNIKEPYRDCGDIMKTYPTSASGVYHISLDGRTIVKTFCDMDTDGGGWLVFQKRFSGQQDFFLFWKDYADGFGSLDGEFWWGFKKLHTLTSQGTYELRVDLTDFQRNTTYALYSSFNVGSEDSNFNLSRLGSYSGIAGNSFLNNIGYPFSTRDRDNDDVFGENLVSRFHGAWWYDDWTLSNLNSRYCQHSNRSIECMRWYHFGGSFHPLASSEMKVRPSSF